MWLHSRSSGGLHGRSSGGVPPLAYVFEDVCELVVTYMMIFCSVSVATCVYIGLLQ